VTRNGKPTTAVTRRQAKKAPSKHTGVRISEDQWKVLTEMHRRSGGKWNKSRFLREAIDEKLERDIPPDTLKEFGYIKSF
jgi:hypothetical protein